MKDPLVRFGVALEGSLLKEIDVLAKERGCTRSELFRDLSRAEVGRAKAKKGVDAVAALTIVYDHHARNLSNKLTELQHELGEGVRSALHVHLTHALCLEVIVLHGRADQLQELADRIRAMRGVKQGAIEIFAGLAGEHRHSHEHEDDEHRHAHGRAKSHSAKARLDRPPHSHSPRSAGSDRG
jgi:CopG family nickel-responsive transcriptional regulator